mgnify:CR=1 FL=1
METIETMAAKDREFLDDCVSMCEAVRCMAEQGAVEFDGREGIIELREEVFDRCFPGMEWEEVFTASGDPVGLREKTASYGGRLFVCSQLDEAIAW